MFKDNQQTTGTASKDRYVKPSAERAVLSLCFKSIESFIEVSSKLAADDFLDDSNRAIFSVFSSLFGEGVEKFDTTTVAAYLNELGVLDVVGGYPYIDALSQSDIDVANLHVYIRKVLGASLLYKLEARLEDSVDKVHQHADRGDYSSEEVISEVEDSILSLSLDTLRIEDGKDISDGIYELLKEYEEEPATIRGIRSGFPILDRLLNGFVGGGLYVVAARPKQGKSTLSTNWACNMAYQQKVPVLYIDTEMSFREDFQPRVISHLSGVPERIIKNGLYTKDEQQREAVYYAAKVMQRMKLIHKYMPGFKMEDVRSVIRKYHARDKIGAVFFDYIKMVELNENFNETQTLGYLTSSLKDLAGVLDIPVITSVQINRMGEGKNFISSDMIADSDRVLRYCNVLMALAPKSTKEIQEHGEECGTHRLQILDNRSGSSFYSGIDLMSKATVITFEEAKSQSTDSIIEQKEIESSIKL